jgi:Leucine-rich repeat (LRR) protein
MNPNEIVAKWIQRGNPRALLDLSDWDIEELPPLPDTVEWLNCSNTRLIKIKVPKNLKRLYCTQCYSLEKIEDIPSTLEVLDCRTCSLLEPLVLPTPPPRILKTNWCTKIEEENRKKRTADVIIEEWIKKDNPRIPLDLSNLKLQELPSLPDTLEHLTISNNPIKTLDGLPKSLKYLNCSNTHITYIDNLPENLKHLCCVSCISLRIMHINVDNITKINAHYCDNLQKIIRLPKSLRNLDISRSLVNYICKFPPTLRSFKCIDTVLEKIPPLPTTLTKLDICMCYIEEIDNIPKSVKYLSFCSNIPSKLPELHEGLMCLIIEDTTTIKNIPSTVEYFFMSWENRVKKYPYRNY